MGREHKPPPHVRGLFRGGGGIRSGRGVGGRSRIRASRGRARGRGIRIGTAAARLNDDTLTLAVRDRHIAHPKQRNNDRILVNRELVVCNRPFGITMLTELQIAGIDKVDMSAGHDGMVQVIRHLVKEHIGPLIPQAFKAGFGFTGRGVTLKSLQAAFKVGVKVRVHQDEVRLVSAPCEGDVSLVNGRLNGRAVGIFRKAESLIGPPAIGGRAYAAHGIGRSVSNQELKAADLIALRTSGIHISVHRIRGTLNGVIDTGLDEVKDSFLIAHVDTHFAARIGHVLGILTPFKLSSRKDGAGVDVEGIVSGIARKCLIFRVFYVLNDCRAARQSLEVVALLHPLVEGIVGAHVVDDVAPTVLERANSEFGEHAVRFRHGDIS